MANEVPAHWIVLDEEWALWRTLCLRSAGFPARRLLALASPEVADAVDGLIERESELGAAQALAVAAPHDDHADEETKRSFTLLLRRIRQGKSIELTRELAADARLASYQSALSAVERAHADVVARYEQADQRSRAVLHAMATDTAFRLAIGWQNPSALRTAVDPMLRHAQKPPNSSSRSSEFLLAKYLQRYCTKNETIGFFGPAGWARFSTSAEPIRLEPGPAVVATRTTYFEYWAIDTLAQKLSEDSELLMDLPPRRAPTLWLEGTTLHHPIEQTTELPREYAAVLAACDGVRSARAIAHALLEDASLEFSDEESVYATLSELVDRRLATWTLEFPVIDVHPDRALRGRLESLPESGARQRALAALTELEVGRDRIARSVAEPAAFDAARTALDETFRRLTSQASERRAGQASAGRAIVYEDCRRDVSVELGQAVLERVRAPMALVLTIARWYSHRLGEQFRHLMEDAYRTLREQTGSSTIDYLRYFERVSPHLTDGSPIVRSTVEELNTRWAALLALPTGERSVKRVTAELAPRVADAFAAPEPGWPRARHHSPDIMIAATSAEAIRRGDFQIVLGEFHANGVSILVNPLLHQHPHPEELLADFASDFERPWLFAGFARDAMIRSFTGHGALTPLGLELEHTGAVPSLPAERRIAIGTLVVEERAGRLEVRTRDGHHRFDVIEFFGNYLSRITFNHFNLYPVGVHTPRVTLDEFVVARERWRFAPQDLPFAQLKPASERFIGARRWARAHGIPRFVFARIPEEPKPVCIDLQSLMSIEILSKMARQGSRVDVSEMLPTTEQCWLVDHEGLPYTSELRLMAVDRRRWTGLPRSA